MTTPDHVVTNAAPTHPANPSGEARRRLLARAIAGLGLAFTLLSLVLYALNPNTPLGFRWAVRGFLGLFAVTFSLVGVLITSRQPRNLIGWLFCGIGLVSGFQFFTDEYAILALLGAPGSLPGGAVMGWFGNWIWILFAVSAWIYTPMPRRN